MGGKLVDPSFTGDLVVKCPPRNIPHFLYLEMWLLASNKHSCVMKANFQVVISKFIKSIA